MRYIYRTVPFSMTFSDILPVSQGHDIFEVEYRQSYYCTRGNYTLYMEWYYVW